MNTTQIIQDHLIVDKKRKKEHLDHRPAAVVPKEQKEEENQKENPKEEIHNSFKIHYVLHTLNSITLFW